MLGIAPDWSPHARIVVRAPAQLIPPLAIRTTSSSSGKSSLVALGATGLGLITHTRQDATLGQFVRAWPTSLGERSGDWLEALCQP